MDKQILQHASLKMLYFYRPDVTAVSTLLSNGLLFHAQLQICLLIIYLTMTLPAAGFPAYNVWT